MGVSYPGIDLRRMQSGYMAAVCIRNRVIQSEFGEKIVVGFTGSRH
jgi:hypothetical protein